MYTRDCVVEKIKNIDDVIEKTLKVDNYSFEDGQGKQAVKYRPLADLREERKFWQGLLDELDGNKNRAPYSIGFNSRK